MTALPTVELPRPFADLRGHRFAERYLVAEVLAVGRSHVVYGATDRERGDVLLRLLRPALLHDPAAIERFVQRSRAAQRARHARSWPALDAGADGNGLLYLICERPPGCSLSRYVTGHENGRLRWPLARGALQGMLDVLKAAHTRRIVHGAMTPDSFWIEERDGSPLLPHLVDLGASHESGLEDGIAEPVGTAALVADMEFTAPETIARGRGDQRTDIYHLGLLTYFMLVGRPPFHGDNQFLVSVQQTREPVPAMRAVVPELPEAVEALVASMLAKDPAARPQTLTKVERALGSIRGEAAVVKVKAREAKRQDAEPQVTKPEEAAKQAAGEAPTPLDAPLAEAGPVDQSVAAEPEPTSLLRYDEVLVPLTSDVAFEPTAVLAAVAKPCIASPQAPGATMVLSAAPIVGWPPPKRDGPVAPAPDERRHEPPPPNSTMAVDEGAIDHHELTRPRIAPSPMPPPAPTREPRIDAPPVVEDEPPPRESSLPVVWLALAFGTTVVAGVVVGIWLAQ